MKRLALLLCLWAAPLAAVEPGEMLDDPALEARARALSAELRCPVCQNESIDESNADLARELRLVVRERLVAGDSDEDVMAYLVARFGEFVLLKPTADGVNLVLWLAAPAMFLLACGVGWAAMRRKQPVIQPLGADEQDALKRILRS